MKPLLSTLSFIVCLALLQILQTERLTAQSLTLFGIDNSTFPVVKGKFFAFDAGGKQLVNFRTFDFKLTEDGQTRNVTYVSCPESKPVEDLSSVLVFDISGSMIDGGLPIAKAAAYAWIDLLPLGKSECAITSFSDFSAFNQDFTTQRQKLTKTIDNLYTLDRTNYYEALLNPYTGAMQAAKLGKHKRVVIFLTDGMPDKIPAVSDVVNLAKADEITIYSITLGFPAPQFLKDISAQTGGMCFENITKTEEAEEIYRFILLNAQGREPCAIEWQSGIYCSTGRIEVNLKLLTNETETKAFYENSSDKAIVSLKMEPSTVKFKNTQPNVNKDTILKVTALNSDFDVTDVTISNPAFKIKPSSFSLKAGQSMDLTLSFLPLDSGYAFANLTFVNDVCPSKLIATGGYFGKKPTAQTIKVTHPNGGEIFVAGSDTIITWEGIAAEDSVILQFSNNSGTTWKMLADRATGFSYNWNNIPKPEKSYCLIKATQLSYRDSAYPGSLVYTLTGHSAAVRGVKWSPDGRFILTYGDSSARIWDGETGQVIYNLNLFNTINYATWNSDGTLVAACDKDSTVTVWDAETGQVLQKIEVQYPLYFMDWHPKSNIIAIADVSTISVWDAETGSQILSIPGQQTAIYSLKWSPNGKLLASAGGLSDMNAKIWDGETGALIYNLKVDMKQPMYLDWNNNGTLLSVTYSDGRARLWYSEFGTEAGILPISNRNVAWSPDGKRVATIGSFDFGAYIWDASADTLMQTLSGHTDYVVKADWSSDSKYVATASNDGTARIWDAENGQSLYTLNADVTDVTDVDWSPDGTLISTSGYDKTAKTWCFVAVTELQSDISDTTFKIVMPWAKAHDVDMKQCVLGSEKDSVIKDLTRNIGSYLIRIDTIYFTGADAASFSLASGFNPFKLEPDSLGKTELRFSPSRIGLHQADAFIVTQIDTLVAKVKGEGIAPVLSVNGTLIDFGAVDVGYYKDTLGVLTVKNTGTSKLAISATKHGRPNDKDFTTLVGAGPFTLDPGETHSMDLRFSPSSPGRTSGTLEFHYGATGSPAVIQLFGQGIGSELTVVNKEIDFGGVETGKYKDTIGAVTIKNTGLAPLKVTSTKHGKPNDIDFSTLSGGGAFVVKPGDSCRMNLRFAPKIPGKTSGTLEFYYEGSDEPAIISLIGEGMPGPPSITVLDSIIDFGLVEIGQIRDTLGAVTIINSGSSPVLIDSTRHYLPNDSDFTTIYGGGRFILQSGDTCRMDLRFKPSNAGKTSGTLEFYYKGEGSPAVIVLKGEGSEGKTAKMQITHYNAPDLVCDSHSQGSIEIANSGGTKALEISHLNIDGTDKNDFSLPATPPITVLPDSAVRLSYDFIPKTPGLKSAVINIRSNARPDSTAIIALESRKDSAGISLSIPYYYTVDFGSKLTGESVDTVIYMTNTGTAYNWAIVPDLNVFQADKKLLPLASGETSSLAISFTGSQVPGIFTEIMIIKDSLCSIEKKVELRCVVKSMLIKLGLEVKNTEGYPGDTVLIPVILSWQQNLEHLKVETLNAKLSYNSPLLCPLEYKAYKIDDTTSAINLENMPLNVHTGEVIANIRFIAALGNSEVSDVKLLEPEPADTFDNIDIKNGQFRLLGICREGGTRLVNANGQPLTLSVRPNPAGESSAEIIYSFGADSWVTLVITNVLGERVCTVADESRSAGLYKEKLNLDDLPSGSYYVILRAGTDVKSVRMEVVK